MEIYRLTTKGQELSRMHNAPRTPEWEVVRFLARRGHATKETITDFVDGASGGTLMKLRARGIIQGG